MTEWLTFIIIVRLGGEDINWSMENSDDVSNGFPLDVI